LKPRIQGLENQIKRFQTENLKINSIINNENALNEFNKLRKDNEKCSIPDPQIKSDIDLINLSTENEELRTGSQKCKDCYSKVQNEYNTQLRLLQADLNLFQTENDELKKEKEFLKKWNILLKEKCNTKGKELKKFIQKRSIK
jgi:hypothetical protein